MQWHLSRNLFPRHNIDACIIFLRVQGRFCWPPSFPCELTKFPDRITKPAGKNRTHSWRPKPNCFSVNVISQRTHRDFLEYSFRKTTGDSRSIPRKNRECQAKHIRRLHDIVAMAAFKRTTNQIERITTVIFPETQFVDNLRQKVFSGFEIRTTMKDLMRAIHISQIVFGGLKIRTITMKDRARKRCSNQNIQTHLPIIIRQGIDFKPVSQDNRIGSPCREREHYDLTCLPRAGRIEIIHSLLHPQCEFGDFICKISQIPLSFVAKRDEFVGFSQIILRLLQAVS